MRHLFVFNWRSTFDEKVETFVDYILEGEHELTENGLKRLFLDSLPSEFILPEEADELETECLKLRNAFEHSNDRVSQKAIAILLFDKEQELTDRNMIRNSKLTSYLLTNYQESDIESAFGEYLKKEHGFKEVEYHYSDVLLCHYEYYGRS